jgi:hypothetical protein
MVANPHSRVVPASSSASVEGYYRLPAVWVGEMPEPSNVSTLNPPVHHATAFDGQAAESLKVRVQRNGLFLFDFSSWPHALPVHIPSYTSGNPVPKRIHEAEIKAEETSVYRARIMNVHQAFMATAEQICGEAGMMGFPVHAWNTYKSRDMHRESLQYGDDVEDVHALSQNVLDNSYHTTRDGPLPRRLIKLEVVSKSFELLSQVLSHRNVSSLVDMVDLLFVGAHRSIEKRFGESVVLSWTVCEQLINIAWKRLLDSNAIDGEVRRINQDRRDKLEGRDYTASVMSEFLELSRQISLSLFQRLEVARRARNAWAHKLQTPSQRAAHTSLDAAQELFRTLFDIPLSLQSGGRGIRLWYDHGDGVTPSAPTTIRIS